VVVNCITKVKRSIVPPPPTNTPLQQISSISSHEKGEKIPKVCYFFKKGTKSAISMFPKFFKHLFSYEIEAQLEVSLGKNFINK